MKVREALAAAFVAEGTEVVFGLMGDGNMYWMTTIGRQDVVRLIHVRHEGSAVAMADGYSRATGKVGVASVTCGPGLTHATTSLTAAARHRSPVVVFTGQTPFGAAAHLQEFDQAPLVTACGAGFISAHRPERAQDDVALAFYRAATERRPIVLSVPLDIQEIEYPWDLEYRPSVGVLPRPTRGIPSTADVDAVVSLLASSEKPVIVAGRGAALSGARAACVHLGEQIGALLTTSLRSKGLFDGEPYDGGICGAFSTPGVRRLLAEADCVLGVGARMGAFTTEAGYMFPEATVIQVDIAPTGYVDGQYTGDLVIEGDAGLTLEALVNRLASSGKTRVGYRTSANLEMLRADAHHEPELALHTDTLDPRRAVREIDSAVPKEWPITIGAGHFFVFASNGLSGRAPDRYHFTYDFGVIGQGLPVAVGVSLGTPESPVAVIEGDGSLLMNIQELECVSRHTLPLLVLVLNDGAFGAEVHKMRSRGFDDDDANFGFPAFAEIAEGFGLRARCATSYGDIAMAVKEFETDHRPTLIDIRISPNIMSPQFRRLYYGDANA